MRNADLTGLSSVPAPGPQPGAGACRMLTAVSAIVGPDGAAGLRAQIMAGLIDDFNRHGDAVAALLARLGGKK